MDTETRAKPITTPALQAHLKAYPRDILAQIVVRQLEKVAMYIPKAPQAIDVAAPTKNEKVVNGLSRPSTHSQMMNALIATKIEQILY